MRHISRTLSVAAAAALLIAPGAAAHAQTTSPSSDSQTNRQSRSAAVAPVNSVGLGQWLELSMPGAGQMTGPFEVVSPGPVAVSFTDMFCAGDRLQALEGTTVLGSGAELVVQPSCGVDEGDPETAFFDRRFSAGLVLLGPGAHQLFFRTLSTFTGGFAGAFRVDRCTAVSPPAGGVVLGTTGDDVLCGGSGPDRLLGRGGRDLLLGAGGADVLLAGSGPSVALSGGAGDDVLSAGAGATSRLLGATGDDVLTGTPGPDALDGGAGDDLLRGLGGDDALASGPGNDALLAGSGDDACLAGAGHNSFAGCEHRQRIVL
jgi:hypothetical protein